MSEHKTDNETLVSALRKLSIDIQSNDGIANACIAEAADRIEELVRNICIWFREHPEDLEGAGFEFAEEGNEDRQVLDFLVKHAEKHGNK